MDTRQLGGLDSKPESCDKNHGLNDQVGRRDERWLGSQMPLLSNAE